MARHALLVALLAGCTRGETPAGPAASDLQYGAPLVVVAATPTLAGRYTATHGELVSGVATPWAEETAELINVDPNALARMIGVRSPAPGRLPMILLSPAHRTGEWSYVRSETARLYQILPVHSDSIRLIVLAGTAPPDTQILGGPASSWIVGVIGENETVAILRLDTQLPQNTSDLLDGISTSLHASDGQILVHIEYSHTGGGEACEQRYAFRVRAEVGPRLVLAHTEYQPAACLALGM